MRVFTYELEGQSRLGIWVDEKPYDLDATAKAVASVKLISKPSFSRQDFSGMNMLDLIGLQGEGLTFIDQAERFIRWQEKEDPWSLRDARLEEDAMKWLPPVVNPPAVFGIGGNSPLFFRDKRFQIPAYPRGFMRPTNAHALLGHKDTVTIPGQYDTMRTSAELAVVIGLPGKDVPESEAMNHVWGYTLVNDMCSDSWKTVALKGEDEERMHEDLTIFTQRASTSYYSRSTDGFAAIGPYIVTKEEIDDPYNLMVYNRLNGIQRERSYTQAMVNGVERTVSFLSRLFMLRPGMIFHLGTMGIDGYTVEKNMLLEEGSYFEIEYEGIGTLRSYVNDQRRV